MYRDHTFQEKLQTYISGTLDEAERVAFEAELKANEMAKLEAEFSRDLADALRDREKDQVATVIRQVIATEGFPPPSQPSTLLKAGLSVAGLTLLALLSWGVYTYGGNRNWWGNNEPEYLKSYLLPLENVIGIPDESLIAPVLQDGLAAYDRADYKHAASTLSKHYLLTKELNVGLYYGTALLLDERPAEAIKVLELVQNANDLPVRESAQWYLALAYLKTKNVANARAILNQIPPDGLYGPQAKQLLAEDLK
jgi:hypothetical protein